MAWATTASASRSGRCPDVFIIDLVCHDGHLFEGWYDSRDAFDDARAGSALSCPSCGDTRIDLRPSFRGIVSRSRAPREPAETPAETATTQTTMTAPTMPLEVQRALSRLLKYVRANTEDAGAAFAARAIAMHSGEEEAKPIHGTSTPEENERLLEEGVPFVRIPIPDIDQN